MMPTSGRPEDGPDACPDCSPKCAVCGSANVEYHQPPVCGKCRHEASAAETLKRLLVLNDPAIGEAMRVSEEAFASDDWEYVKIPRLPQGEPRGPKGVECGECGERFDYGKPYAFSCSNTRCPLQRRFRSAAGLLLTP